VRRRTRGTDQLRQTHRLQIEVHPARPARRDLLQREAQIKIPYPFLRVRKELGKEGKKESEENLHVVR